MSIAVASGFEDESGRPSEQELYTRIWDCPEYRLYSPGEHAVQDFLRQARPDHGASVFDIGCGTGRGALGLALFGGLNVTMFDFAPNCLDEDIIPMMETQKHALRFVQHDLIQPFPSVAPYGYCCDVMEHIPPDDVDRVLDNILHACQHCYFQIATTPDVMGELVGYPLHLTVQPYSWWLTKFAQIGCVIHYSKDFAGQEGHHLGRCTFYVTAWATGQDMVECGVLNTEEEQVLRNVTYNIAQGWKQVTPHETNDVEVMILGGSPSLNQFEDKIKEMREQGVKLITLNGAYNWAIDHGMTPSAQIIVDARPFNARFVQPVVEGCKYLIASQCDPSVFEGADPTEEEIHKQALYIATTATEEEELRGPLSFRQQAQIQLKAERRLPQDRTLIWHTSAPFIREVLDAQYGQEPWYGVMGGSTVLLRAIPLLRMLGFASYHLFGCDSCIMDGQHHAYEQPENAGNMAAPVLIGNKTFYCEPWMLAQASELIELVQALGDVIQLEIYGDGLLAYILEYGCELALQDIGKRLELI